MAGLLDLGKHLIGMPNGQVMLVGDTLQTFFTSAIVANRILMDVMEFNAAEVGDRAYWKLLPCLQTFEFGGFVDWF